MLATANPASSQNVQTKAVAGIEVAANPCCKKIAKPVIPTGPPKRWQILDLLRKCRPVAALTPKPSDGPALSQQV